MFNRFFKKKNKQPILLVAGAPLEAMQHLHDTALGYELLTTNQPADQLLDTVEKIKPPVLVLYESYLEEVDYREMVLKLITRYQHVVRVVYVLSKEDFWKRDFFYRWSLFDVVLEESVDEIIHAIQVPKPFSDVVVEMGNFPPEIREWRRNFEMYDADSTKSTLS